MTKQEMTKETVLQVNTVRLWITRAAPHMHIDASGTVSTGG